MHTLDASIQSMTPGHELAGPAFTVLAQAGSIIAVHKALMEAPAGAVLVVGGETRRDQNGALFGKLMAIQAQRGGIAGLVVDGPVRDRAGEHIGDLIGFRELIYPMGQSDVPAK